MEYLSVFDSNKRNLNKMVMRCQKLKEGEYYLISETCIISNNGLLITLRASTKETDPNKWDIIGGHVRFGETSREAAQREIKEELGVKININDLIYMRTEQNDKLFSDLYLLNMTLDLNQIEYQKDEIAAIKVVDSKEFLQMLESKCFSENVTNRLKKSLDVILCYM